MEHYHSKKSSIRDNTVVYEALDRGHQSDITRVKKPDKAINASGRRMFTFMGSASGKQQQQRAHAAPPSRSRTPSKIASTPRTRTPHSKQIPPRSRSQSVVKHKPPSIKLSDKHDRSSRSKLSESKAPSLKSKRDVSSVSRVSDSKKDQSSRSASKKDRTSRSASVTGKKTSRSSSANSKTGEATSEQGRKSKSNTPITIELPSPGQQGEIISPAILVGDEQKIEIKDEPGSPVLPVISSPDEDDRPEEEELSTSPSVVGYRKLVYNEEDDKWVEHWKIEEDIRRAKKKAKEQKLLKKLEADKRAPKVHPVKGRITAKIQVMFPTAIVKQDRRHGGALYQSILMTDPLRIELHKRRAPIVPTYYQEHIAKYGKLPFRNNPRPHPIV